MQKDLVDFLLSDLRSKPGMYLTAYSLSYLDIFLTGVLIATSYVDKSGEYSERFFGEKGFISWSLDKYNLGKPSFRLHHYLDFANGNEKIPLDLFFEDLEAYHSGPIH